MDILDPKKAQRVWERVTAAPTRQESLKALLLTMQETARIYQALAAKLGGQTGARLRQLYEQERRCITALRGLCRLQGDEVGLLPMRNTKELPRNALEQCCRRVLMTCGECQSRMADPEFGIVFSELARRQRENAMVLLELLGI